MKKKELNLLFCLLLLFSCSSSQKKEEEDGSRAIYKEISYPLTVNLKACMDTPLDNIKLSSFVENICYVPLQADEDTYLNGLLGIDFDEESSCFLISDIHNVFVVDTLGRYISKIGRIGQGPGEYKQIANMTVNMVDKHIYINTCYKHNVITYDYNGKVINESPSNVDMFTGYIFYYDHALWGVGSAYTSRAMRVKGKRRFYGYALLDSLCKRTSLQTACPMDKIGEMEGLEAFLTPPCVSICGKIILLAQNNGAPSDTIYTIQNKKFVPRYLLNYGSHRPDITKIWSKDRDNAKYNSYLTMSPAYETDRFFFIENLFRNKYYIVVYDKYAEKNFSIPMYSLGKEGQHWVKGLENDIDGGFPFYPQSVSSDGTYWLTYMKVPDMKELLTEEYFVAHSNILDKKKQDELKAIIAKADEEANPILVLLKLKK